MVKPVSINIQAPALSQVFNEADDNSEGIVEPRAL
jgi:hypothetical protein